LLRALSVESVKPLRRATQHVDPVRHIEGAHRDHLVVAAGEVSQFEECHDPA
jgi:hypothetical protein